LAKLIAKSGFLECVVCPGFSPVSLDLLKAKKNLRLLELPGISENVVELDFKRVHGGLLVEDEDSLTLDQASLKVVTKKKPSSTDLESLIFAWKVAKHVKSNAIILARGTKTVGIGAGQMSRVDSVFITKRKAGKLTKNSCLASDAFFPKDDAVLEAAKMGVKAIIQPGGSISDEEIIQAYPQFSDMKDVFLTAWPRPRTPLYPAVSNALQYYFHKVISGPTSDIEKEAHAASREIDRILSLVQ